MATLTVRCKACGAQVFSGIRTGWVSAPVLGERELACPACRTRALYHGRDFAPAATGLAAEAPEGSTLI